MKNLRPLVLVSLCIALAAPAFAQELSVSTGAKKTWSGGTPAVSLSLGAGVGNMSYEENFSVVDVTSEWDASFVGLDGQVRIDDATGWVVQFGGAIWVSGEDEEEWSKAAQTVQRNDLEVGTVEFLAEVGYIIFKDQGVTVLPLLGFRARRQEFDRRDARVLAGDFAEWDEAEEDVDIGSLNLALEVVQESSSALDLIARLDLGFVTASQAYNSLLDAEIDGDGGVIFAGSFGAEWRVDDDNRVAVSLNYELQDLQGDTTDVRGFDQDFNRVTYELEWPDNETERVWGELSYSHSF